MNMSEKEGSDAFRSGGCISRREALQRGLLVSAGMLMGPPITAFGRAAKRSAPVKAKATAVIQVWLWGGASHMDTFDPKPDAGQDYTGPLKNPIATNVAGVRINELLPQLAKHADKYSLIRSMTHGVNGHETAAYLVQTARQPGNGSVFPCAGAVVSLFKGRNAGYDGLIPPYIVLTKPQGRFSEAGFLGSRYKPFATGGDPARTPFVVEGVVAEGITEQRQRARRELLNELNALPQAMPGNSEMAALRQCDQQAYDLILGDAGKVFDLSGEKESLRDLYGRTTFGQSCVLARRLVEKGVPYITINYNGWDTHKGHFQTMQRKLPELDKGLATLFQDLSDRGLLENTIVWCCGEFGRTPRVQWEAPWNGGRGHYGKVFSVLVAGGGFVGGQVVGSSTEKGEEVQDRPVYPVDLIGSMYELLGIDSQATLPHPQGQLVSVLAEPGDDTPSGGRLTEIM